MQAYDGKTLPQLQAEHMPPPRGRLDPHEAEGAEQSSYRNYVRDLILGFNDGVVSVYAVCAGLAGASFASSTISVAGVAASVAGALSMGLGEYLSTKSQSQYYASEARREKAHIKAYPELETQELREMLEARSYPPAIVDGLVEHLSQDESRFVDFMMREEFGIGKESDRSPWAAMGIVMAAFLVGAALAVAPYFLVSDARGLAASSGIAVAGLFAAGAAKGRLSGLGMLKPGLEMALLGSLAAAITYGIGSLFNVAV